MSNFSDYIKQGSREKTNKSSVSQEKELEKDDLEELINKYSSYNQNDLMSEFLRLTYEKKKKGELNSQELNNLKQTVLPFLNDEQKKNLDKILSIVENVK